MSYCRCASWLGRSADGQWECFVCSSLLRSECFKVWSGLVFFWPKPSLTNHGPCRYGVKGRCVLHILRSVESRVLVVRKDLPKRISTYICIPFRSTRTTQVKCMISNQAADKCKSRLPQICHTVTDSTQPQVLGVLSTETGTVTYLSLYACAEHISWLSSQPTKGTENYDIWNTNTPRQGKVHLFIVGLVLLSAAMCRSFLIA
jgi:hypothetical protein